MIGWTLGRYFLRRFLVLTAWTFAGVFSLVFILSFTEASRRMAGFSDFTVGWALAYATLQTPLVMQQAVPFVCLISAMSTLVSLNRKYELVVARAAGISAWQFLTPIAVGAFLVGAAAVLVLNPVASHGLARTQIMDIDMRGSRPSGQDEGSLWLKQRTSEGETYVGARAAFDSGRELAGVVFLRIGDDGIVTERLDAARAYLRDGRWELVDVTRLLDGRPPESLERTSLATNLSAEFVGERLVDPETVSFFALPRMIDAARAFGYGANGFAMQFHSLAALPMLLVAMTLIAATVSMRFARTGQSGSMILGGIVAGFLLYVVSVLVKAFGTAGVVPPMAAAWFPVVLASFFGVTFLLYKEDG